MFSVSETAKQAGISVRTLHYYDEIGLLRPSMVAKTGYRYYDDAALLRLQQILFFRELDFPLDQIKLLLDHPTFDKEEVFKQQKDLLRLKAERLNGLIRLLERLAKGDDIVELENFKMDEIIEAKEKYRSEAEERWGNTDAYRESTKRTAKYSKEDWEKIINEERIIYQDFASLVGSSPESERAQELVSVWKNHLSRYYYSCTNEILEGLGEMYVADERFTKNIDKYKTGTAEFIRDAIRIFTK